MAGVIPVTDGFLHLDYKFTATLVLKNIEDSWAMYFVNI